QARLHRARLHRARLHRARLHRARQHSARQHSAREAFEMSAETSVPEQWEAAGLGTSDSGLPDAVLRDSPAGVAFLGDDHRFAWVTPALAQMYGRPAGDFTGRTLAEALPPLDAGRAEAALRRVLGDGEPAVETFAAGSLPAGAGAPSRVFHW